MKPQIFVLVLPFLALVGLGWVSANDTKAPTNSIGTVAPIELVISPTELVEVIVPTVIAVPVMQQTGHLSSYWYNTWPRVASNEAIIIKWANQYTVDPNLIAALIAQESGGNPNAVSHSGAVGLTQIMASDLTRYSYGRTFADRPTSIQLKDPDFNVGWGVHFLVTLYNRFGHNWREALYHYGPIDRGYSYADLVLSHYERAGEYER